MHSAPLPTWLRWQRVLNEHWPSGPAYLVPVAPAPIPVRVGVVWATDGREWVDGLAVRWTRDAVMVQLDEPRLGPLATWFAPHDVARRDASLPVEVIVRSVTDPPGHDQQAHSVGVAASPPTDSAW